MNNYPNFLNISSRAFLIACLISFTVSIWLFFRSVELDHMSITKRMMIIQSIKKRLTDNRLYSLLFKITLNAPIDINNGILTIPIKAPCKKSVFPRLNNHHISMISRIQQIIKPTLYFVFFIRNVVKTVNRYIIGYGDVYVNNNMGINIYG